MLIVTLRSRSSMIVVMVWTLPISLQLRLIAGKFFYSNQRVAYWISRNWISFRAWQGSSLIAALHSTFWLFWVFKICDSNSSPITVCNPQNLSKKINATKVSISAGFLSRGHVTVKADNPTVENIHFLPRHLLYFQNPIALTSRLANHLPPNLLIISSFEALAKLEEPARKLVTMTIFVTSKSFSILLILPLLSFLKTLLFTIFDASLSLSTV